MKLLFAKHKSVLLTTIIGLVLISILMAVPTGYEDARIYKGTERATGTVVKTDDSAIVTSGLVQSGEQSCILEIEDGIFKGRELEGVNFLSGSLEKDKIFKAGDRALLIFYHNNTDDLEGADTLLSEGLFSGLDRNCHYGSIDSSHYLFCVRFGQTNPCRSARYYLRSGRGAGYGGRKLRLSNRCSIYRSNGRSAADKKAKRCSYSTARALIRAKA